VTASKDVITGRADSGQGVREKTNRKAPGGRKIALFGGTFDPVHLGHMAVAHAAQRRFRFDCIFFIPAGRPPHKAQSDLSPFVHRYAMTTLACAENLRFVPSLAEAGADGVGSRMVYSIDTVRRFREEYSGARDELYFLLGADSFLQLATWKKYDALLDSCNFVVASRPGFRSSALREVIPPKLLAQSDSSNVAANSRVIQLRRTTVHLLDTVASYVSATEVRDRLDRGLSVRRLVPARVEEYINKQALYK
jgi:nicotinate-nucleotide adenylyltransferase